MGLTKASNHCISPGVCNNGAFFVTGALSCASTTCQVPALPASGASGYSPGCSASGTVNTGTICTLIPTDNTWGCISPGVCMGTTFVNTPTCSQKKCTVPTAPSGGTFAASGNYTACTATNEVLHGHECGIKADANYICTPGKCVNADTANAIAFPTAPNCTKQGCTLPTITSPFTPTYNDSTNCAAGANAVPYGTKCGITNIASNHECVIPGECLPNGSWSNATPSCSTKAGKLVSGAVVRRVSSAMFFLISSCLLF